MAIQFPIRSLLPGPDEILPDFALPPGASGPTGTDDGAPADAAPAEAAPADGMAADAVLDGGERRSEERVALDLVIFTYPLGETERAPSRSESRNVSTTGMFIASERPPAKGELLFLEAFPNGSDEEAVRSRAVVRWRRRWLEPRGMGVELLDVGEDERRRLLRWMGEGA